MSNYLKAMAAIVTMAVSSECISQAEIVDSEPISGKGLKAAPIAAEPAQSALDQSEFYYQMQMLQQEVQQLRGIVDEQAHEIRNLKQQQLDDYVDLDRRLSQLSKTSTSSLPASMPTTDLTNTTAAKAEVEQPAPGLELTTYDKAVRLIIKDKQLSAGAEAMKAYLSAYPKGVYVSNAQYWLGQVSFIQGDLEDAKKWFGELLRTDPSSQKAPEAKYKLAAVLHKLGDVSNAKSLLTELAGTGTSVARLAQEYLKNNF